MTELPNGANTWGDSANCKIFRDVVVQCEKEIEARPPDVAVLDKTSKEVKIFDIVIPGDVRVSEKEVEKINNFKLLKAEIARLWSVRKVTVIPIVVRPVAKGGPGGQGPLDL